jgi:hypothetical protein
VAEIRNSRKLKMRAVEVRESCDERGVFLTAAEAEEALAGSVRDAAVRLGITERTLVDSYLTDEFVAALVDALVAEDGIHQDAMHAAEPMSIACADVGGVIAALGMIMKLVTDALDRNVARADSMGIATDCADAVVGLGVAVNHADPGGPVQVDGRTLVYSRRVLQRAIRMLRDGTWECSCHRRPHEVDDECTLRHNLMADLRRIGGWDSGKHEPPAAQR